ncbi:hypothetical protein LV92_02938 [Arenibacter echinorum]|uniref:Glycine dehydrogenase n=1 Tax=Arenibacter echinorum TaxID=440515 RepID=A0A327R0P4_9FLAO|nr:hypothetical protein LV92_02938 [Arenibacter echinorum]
MKSCKDVEIICTKVQYKEASFLEKIKIKLHVLFCKTCKTFSKKNTELTSLCSQANIKTLPIEEKEKMKTKLKSRN